MIIKFLKDDSTYSFENGGYESGENRVRFDSSEIPAVDGGFHVITDLDAEVTYYEKFTTVYEKADDYIEFTSDNTIYKVYALYNEKGYVTEVKVTSENLENAVKLAEGKGNVLNRVTLKEVTDSNGNPNYHVIDGKIEELTEEEKSAYEKAVEAEKAEEEAKAEAEAKKKAEEEAAAAEEALTVEEVAETKIAELKEDCQKTIVSGIDYNGKHYSFATEDQLNISNAVSLANSTGMDIPYHADGESCELYTKEEIMAIYMAEQINLTKNTTYFNQLKLYVLSLETKEEIRAVVYGETELTGAYKDTYDSVIEQTDAIGAAIANA